MDVARVRRFAASVGVDLGRVFRLAGGVRGGSGGEGSLFRLLLLVLVLVVSLRKG